MATTTLLLFTATALLLLQAGLISSNGIHFLHVSEDFLGPSTVTFASVSHNQKGRVCKVLTKPVEIVAAAKNAQARNEVIHRVNRQLLQSVLNTCPKSQFLSGVVLQQSGLIFPGTKWCGPGDIAENYDDLGPEIETDMCCRDHDHCDTIIAGQTKFNLTNVSPFSRLHCDCDTAFTKCLQKANTMVGHSIGDFYFNLVKNLCYDLNHPIISCKKSILPKTCEEFEFDESKPKLYQWFLPKFYKKEATP